MHTCRACNTLILVTLAFICVRSSAIAQTNSSSLQSVLEQRLKGGILSLREASPAAKLHFDRNALLIGTREHGIASLDRDILVKDVRLANGVLSIQGQRIFYIWNQQKNRLEGSAQPGLVLIDIDFPQQDITEVLVGPVFNKIFLSSMEKDAFQCTPEESKATQQYFELSDRERLRLIEKGPDAKHKTDLTTLCLATGVRGYRPAKGLQVPKPTHTSDPEYSPGMHQSRGTASAVYAIVVDQNGLVTDALLLRPVEPNLQFLGAKALRDWRFNPAKLAGEALPAVVFYELNFPWN